MRTVVGISFTIFIFTFCGMSFFSYSNFSNFSQPLWYMYMYIFTQHLWGRVIQFVLFSDHLCWIVSGFFEHERFLSLKYMFGKSLSDLRCVIIRNPRIHYHFYHEKILIEIIMRIDLGAFWHGFLHIRCFSLWYISKLWFCLCTFHFPNKVII